MSGGVICRRVLLLVLQGGGYAVLVKAAGPPRGTGVTDELHRLSSGMGGVGEHLCWSSRGWEVGAVLVSSATAAVVHLQQLS